MRKFCKFGLLSILMLSFGPAEASQDSDVIKLLRSQAVEAQFKGDSEAALEKYKQALSTATSAYGVNSPFLAEIYFDMGSLCLSSTNPNFVKAEEYLNQTVKLSPNSSAAHLRLAELMRLKGRADLAAKHAATVVAKHSDDVVAHEELAMAYGRGEDSVKAYREYSKLDSLIQLEKDRYEGKVPPAKIVMPTLPPKPKDDAASKAAEEAAKAAEKAKADEEAKKDAADAKKKADLDKKNSAAEQKKQKEQAKKEAAEAKKKADLEKKNADAAKKKAEQDKKNADAAKKKAEDAKRKAEEAKKKAAPAAQPAKPVETETTMSGLPAALRGKAVLLTPVAKKKPVTAESTTVVPAEKKPAPAPKAVVKPASSEAESADTDEAAEPKKVVVPAKKPAKPAESAIPKPGKHAPGLVPPPPPVMNYPPMQIMQAPPPQPVQKPKAVPKKEEKPKEQPAAKEDKPDKAEDDDFLLDWGGAKGKKK